MFEVLGMIRKMRGIRRNTGIPLLLSSNRTAVSNNEKAELLAIILDIIQNSQFRKFVN